MTASGLALWTALLFNVNIKYPDAQNIYCLDVIYLLTMFIRYLYTKVLLAIR